MTRSPAQSQSRWRVGFVCYALALVTATHWPALKIGTHGIHRLDLLIHAGAFGAWTVLLILSGFFGPRASRRNIALSIFAAVGYALIDEVSQGIPILRRTVDPLDLAANAAGIAAAGLGSLLIARTHPRTRSTDNT